MLIYVKCMGVCELYSYCHLEYTGHTNLTYLTHMAHTSCVSEDIQAI